MGAAVAVAAGCASAPPVPRWKDPEPWGASPAVSDAVGAPAASVTPSDQRFVAAVRGKLPEVTVDLRNEEITEIGGQACASLAAGRPRRAVAAEVAEYGLAAADARALVALARRTLCGS
ncbi:hypothetical protein Aph02nite_89860 [Actinoplanes philippinensis]|nr:hypothetical protein Aph02nite_89860 [Actinoplanes philippinensis]